MIRPNDGPEGDSNKFLVMYRDGSEEGHRGDAIAIRDDGKEAILRGLTFRQGSLLLVRETSPGMWPSLVRAWSGPVPAGWKSYKTNPISDWTPQVLLAGGLVVTFLLWWRINKSDN